MGLHAPTVTVWPTSANGRRHIITISMARARGVLIVSPSPRNLDDITALLDAVVALPLPQDMSVDRSYAYGSLLPSAVMVGYPRRLTDAPRHQQNRQNGAIGTISRASTPHHQPHANERLRRNQESTGKVISRDERRSPRRARAPSQETMILIEKVYANEGGQHVYSSESTRQQFKDPAHDKGWTGPPATLKDEQEFE